MALRMNAKDSLFLIVDIQEKLAPVMFHKEDVIAENVKLLKTAKTLNIPYLVTEQYPQGIGGTVSDLSDLFEPSDVVEKMTFSSMGEPSFVDAIEKKGKKQIIVSGMETHVCVLQTVMDLLDAGYNVFVVEDAVSSRTAKNKLLGLDRMRHAGAHIVSTEMVMFEWLERAGTADFKAVLPLIK